MKPLQFLSEDILCDKFPLERVNLSIWDSRGRYILPRAGVSEKVIGEGAGVERSR